MQGFMLKKILGPKLPYLGIFGLEFEKIIVIFKASIFKFVKKQSLMLKEKALDLEPTMPYLSILDWDLKKAIVIF